MRHAKHFTGRITHFTKKVEHIARKAKAFRGRTSGEQAYLEGKTSQEFEGYNRAIRSRMNLHCYCEIVALLAICKALISTSAKPYEEVGQEKALI